MSTDKISHTPKYPAHSAAGSAVRTTAGAKPANPAQMRTKASSSTVVRTGRGLTIAGTRTTLYSVMDYLKADWPPELIRDWIHVTDQQMTDVMDYIEKHREQVEAEYEAVLRQAEENRRYWQERHQEHSASDTARPTKPGQEELRAKLEAWKEKLNAA